MRYSVSNTAQYGDITRGPRVVGAEVKQRMKEVLTEIQDGTFAREWIEECKSGKKNFDALTNVMKVMDERKVGSELRDMMSWLKDSKIVDRNKN